MKEKFKKIWDVKGVKTFVIIVSFVVISVFALWQQGTFDKKNYKNGNNYTLRFPWDNKQEVHDIVYSKNADKAIWSFLKDEDNKGVIKSYTIIKNSLYKDPMGGYNFEIYINNNKKLWVGVQLSDVNRKWEDWTVGMDISKELNDIIQ